MQRSSNVSGSSSSSSSTMGFPEQYLNNIVPQDVVQRCLPILGYNNNSSQAPNFTYKALLQNIDHIENEEEKQKAHQIVMQSLSINEGQRSSANDNAPVATVAAPL